MSLPKYMYELNVFVGPGDYIGIIPPVDPMKKETGIVQIVLSYMVLECLDEIPLENENV